MLSERSIIVHSPYLKCNNQEERIIVSSVTSGFKKYSQITRSQIYGNYLFDIICKSMSLSIYLYVLSLLCVVHARSRKIVNVFLFQMRGKNYDR